MSALASAIGTGAVSPPEVETCISSEWPFTCSEKYSRVPSVTRERFDAPSLVICSDEITTGGDSGDLTTQSAATTAAMATAPAASHRAIFDAAILTLGFAGTVAAAVANRARILSFESGGRAAVPLVEPWPPSKSRRRR